MHRKGKRRHDQHGPCRLSRYLSCSCFRLRLGCDTIFCLFFLGLVLPVSFFVQRANRYHDMGMGIVPGRIWIMDSNIGAHPISNKTVLNEIRQKFLPL